MIKQGGSNGNFTCLISKNISSSILLPAHNLNRINVSYLASGILFIIVETDQSILVKKVIKE